MFCQAMFVVSICRIGALILFFGSLLVARLFRNVDISLVATATPDP